jgi:hypothetical protein
MNMIGEYLKFEKSAIMHVCMGEPIAKVPSFLWWFLLQVVFTLFVPIYYPATQEAMDMVMRGQILAVNALLILIITSFVSKVLVLTYTKNMEQREVIRTQHLLSIGDVGSIAASLQSDCLIVQGKGETAESYNARLDRARLSATKSFWVISIAKGSAYVVCHLSPKGHTTIMPRASLNWEDDKDIKDRIVSPGYDFDLETQENYALYIALFVEGWRKWSPTGKVELFKDDPKAQIEIASSQIKDN